MLGERSQAQTGGTITPQRQGASLELEAEGMSGGNWEVRKEGTGGSRWDISSPELTAAVAICFCEGSRNHWHVHFEWVN